ncbi:hypothetical protein [Ascidiaceihabitans sp.]|uniref:hypothetical protein n=1 Tax=Ascidiaceihabitans sp. TaxID=1872644 RepID=UPI003299A9CD
MIWRAVGLALCLCGTVVSAGPRPQIETDGVGAQAKQAILQDAYRQVETYFEKQHGLALDQPFVLVGTDMPEDMGARLAKGLRALDRRPLRRPIDTERLCGQKRIGAAANRNYILMCWQQPDAYDAAWRAALGPRLTQILAHEFTHQIQYQLAQDRPARRSKPLDDWLLGPNWMVEGTAEVIETDFVTPIAAFTGKDVFEYQNRARRSRLTLSEMSKSSSVKGPAGYGVSRFACLMLARKHGISALFDYFEALGKLKDRDRAFEVTFGQTFAAFEADFEKLRRDFGAARDYGRDGS